MNIIGCLKLIIQTRLAVVWWAKGLCCFLMASRADTLYWAVSVGASPLAVKWFLKI